MDTLCAHWNTIVEPEKPRLRLASHWYPCLVENRRIDQEALARAWGLLEALDRPPVPSLPSFGVAIR
jgi:hypothetical protein